MYRCTPPAVLYVPGMMRLLSSSWAAGTERDMCWLVREVQLTGWLLRGIAKRLPFPADAAGTSTLKQNSKTKGESYHIGRN